MRTDVVLLNFGGPRKAEEVEPFLRKLFEDPDVIKLPGPDALQPRFAKVLSGRRATLVTDHYAHIGFSPLVPTTFAQVEAIKEKLGADAPRFHVGMRYTAPTIEDMVADIKKDAPDRIVAIALYPHYSDTTTGSSFNVFAQAMGEAGLGNLPVHYVPAFYDHPKYVEAMVGLINDALGRLDEGVQPYLLFSAHGLPSSYARDDGDPYPNQIQDSVRMIIRAMGWTGDYGLSFQSRVGPVRWLEPATDAELIRLAQAGVKDAVVIPISFTTEGIETLYEIDVELRDIAQPRGLTLHRVATVDVVPAFIECIADVLEKAIADTTEGGLGKHRCIRCLLPRPHAHRTKVDCLDCGHRTPEYLLRLPIIR